MKKILLFSVLFVINFTKAEIKKVTLIGGDYEFLSKNLVKFETTGTSKQTGPDISKLITEKRKFFAKLDLCGIADKWYTFENNIDANTLQKLCYDGRSMNVEWYYLDEKVE